MANSIEILTQQERAENTEKRENLIRLIKSKGCILMAGAGLTASIFPPWGDLMKTLAKVAQEVDPEFHDFDPEEGDYLSYAQEVQNIAPDRFQHIIYKTYKRVGKIGHEKYHETICRIPFLAITTTNYDQVIESALCGITGSLPESLCINDSSEKAKIYEFMSSLNEWSQIDKVLHLHGLVGQNDSIILSESQYNRAYGFTHRELKSSLYEEVKGGGVGKEEFDELLKKHGNWTRHRKILWALLATRRILFIGFSLNDPYFRKMLDTVKDDLHTFDYATHYVVSRTTSSSKLKDFAKAKLLRSNYGVETIFYEDDEISYVGLPRFIEDLYADVNSGDIGDKTDELSKQYNALDGDTGLTQRLIEKSRKRNNNENR